MAENNISSSFYFHSALILCAILSLLKVLLEDEVGISSYKIKKPMSGESKNDICCFKYFILTENRGKHIFADLLRLKRGLFFKVHLL